MKKIFLATFIFVSANLFAQPTLIDRPDESTPAPAPVNHDRFVDHLFTGGGLGLSFGSNETYVEIAPIIGYRFTERFSAGMNLKYIYYKINDQGYHYSTNIYGGGPFARFFIYEGLFAHVEYELLNLDVPNLYGPGEHRDNISSVFVGGGYRQMISDYSSFDILLLYNINDYTGSPYTNPLLRIGFTIGL